MQNQYNIGNFFASLHREVEEVVARANNTEYGLASGVMTKDISKALLVSEKLDAGTCFVNTYNKTDVAAPFGGFKQSGFGKDLGKEALHEYLKTKTITFEYWGNNGVGWRYEMHCGWEKNLSIIFL